MTKTANDKTSFFCRRPVKYPLIFLLLFLSGFLVRFYIKNIGVVKTRQFQPFLENLRNPKYVPVIAAVLILWVVMAFLLARSRKTSFDRVALTAAGAFTPFLLLSFQLLGYCFDIDHDMYRLMMSLVLGLSLSWSLTLFYRGEGKPLSVRTCWAVLVIVMLFYLSVYSYHNIAEYYMCKKYPLDFGGRTNMLWNTVHGRFLYTELHRGFFLKNHFSPILSTLSLPYLTPYGTYFRIIIKNLLAICVVIPLFLLAKEKIKHNFAALCMALSILLLPNYQTGIFSLLYAAHFEPILVVFILYFIEKKKWFTYGLCCLLLLICMEDKFLVLTAIGIYLAVFRKQRIAGLITIIFALAAGWSILNVVMPAFRETNSNVSQHIWRYYWIGDSLGDMFRTVVTRPGYFFGTLFNASRCKVLLGIFVPFLLLPFVSGGALIVALPMLLGHLLSGHIKQQYIVRHYAMSVFPLVVTTVIYGTQRIIEKRISLPPLKRVFSKLSSKKIGFFVACYILIAGAHLTLVSKKTTTELLFKRPGRRGTGYREFIKKARREIPAASYVYASDRDYAFLIERKHIYLLPGREKGVGVEEELERIVGLAKANSDSEIYTTIDTGYCRWLAIKRRLFSQKRILFAHENALFPQRALFTLLDSGYFSIYDYYTDSHIILKTNHHSETTGEFINRFWKRIEAENIHRNRRYGKIIADKDASNTKAIFISQDNEMGKYLVVGPVPKDARRNHPRNKRYPPGEYTATFYLKIQNLSVGQIALIDVSTFEDENRTALASVTVDGSDFQQAGEYFPFTLPFSIDKFQALEFRVKFLGNADIFVDRIVVDSPALEF